MTVTEAPSPTTVRPVTRRDVLHRAADVLEEWGWKRWTALNDPLHYLTRGPSCLLKAVVWARIDLGETPPVIRDDAVDQYYAFGYEPLTSEFPDYRAAYSWNDHHARSYQEVVARLRAAAEQTP